MRQILAATMLECLARQNSECKVSLDSDNQIEFAFYNDTKKAFRQYKVTVYKGQIVAIGVRKWFSNNKTDWTKRSHYGYYYPTTEEQ